MKQPTNKQRDVLTFLVEFVRFHYRQPTLKDFAEEFGISREGVRGHLLALERKNLIEYSGNGPRNIHITDDAFDLVDGSITEEI